MRNVSAVDLRKLTKTEGLDNLISELFKVIKSEHEIPEEEDHSSCFMEE